MNTIRKVKYLVIGAGISGLSFVNFIGTDKDYIILEEQNTPGGYCKTTYRDGFVWDYAGHFFHFNNPEIKEFFLDKIDTTELIYSKKDTKIFVNGQYVDYPFQKNIHQLPKEEFIDCLYELYFRKKNDNPKSFAEMMYANFGKGISELFLKPYNEKLYACDLNSLDVNAMGRFFPYASLDDIVSNFKSSNNTSYNDEFMYHKRGAYAFVEALLKGLNVERIICNTKVTKIDYEGKKVYTESGTVYFYEYLVNTASFNDLIVLLEGVHSKVLSCNKVSVFNLGFDAPPKDTSIHWIYYPEKKYTFYRVGFYNNILKEENMSLYVEIGHRTSDSNIDDLEMVLDQLKAVGIVDDQKLVAHEFISMSPAYVHISQESKKYVEEKMSLYAGFNIFTLGRYGRWEYSSIEDAVMGAKKLAAELRSEI